MKRNKFSLSNTKLLSCDMGELVPIGLTEVLPGDSIQQATSALIRSSPLLAPVMHPVNIRIHHWFVPHRLSWSNWENFITGGPDGNDESVFPYVTAPEGGFPVGSLADYLGCPTSVAGLQVSALPFRAYARIWNEFYRDQDLQTELAISSLDGEDVITNTSLQNAAWEKDYFTSSRPFAQKGPAVTLPLGDSAPVKGIGKLNGNWGGGVNVYETGTVGLQNYSAARQISDASADNEFYIRRDLDGGPEPSIFADLAEATSSTINELRTAFAIQRYQEARARYGSRYTEYLRYLGVKSSDARLQRPEYLGGGKQTLQFSEVLQTAEGEDPVGALKGHGIGAMRSNRYRRFFEEHGYIVSFISVMPKTIYAQGLPRTWNRRTKEDFFQKELQHIGQQEVLVKEVYGAAANPDLLFGYQDRYDEYRRQESTIAGEFRSTLNFWHYARIFGSEPALNADFIESVPTKRVNAVQSTDVLWIMVNHSIQARRIVSAAGNSFIS